MKLQGKVALVTGGARGLGRQMAIALAEEGAQVIITASAPSRQLDETLALLPDARSLIFDVSDPAAIDAALAGVGPVDILINNAGRGMRLASEKFTTEPVRFWTVTDEVWSRIVATNLDGPFYMARRLVPGMLARGFGRIINISTSTVTMARAGYAPYGPSKAGLEAATLCWAQDLAGTGVTVHSYLPGGASDTDLLPEMAVKKGADGNLLDPALMRRGIRWLCSEDSAGLTGGRFVARLWPEGAGDLAAAKAAWQPLFPLPALSPELERA